MSRRPFGVVLHIYERAAICVAYMEAIKVLVIEKNLVAA
jgi:hypothetical protein